MLLEVRQGDELYQVARWHCLRYSLGAERVPVLSNRLEKVRGLGPSKGGRCCSLFVVMSGAGCLLFLLSLDL